ncbi:uncharacterized protein LOC108864036 [Galendromus occidentalis]|uniref:Uncharacterized protein LOC108864036 n=1 Tax=Galendromus occidentalis TaxID=34638 RepID=A0AAJ7P9C5_9ACAR|nr:uncharacterized protein LOC108864036 [Galendromus occidentalis]
MESTSGVTSQRGQEKLAHDGHLFVKAYVLKSGLQSWRCMYKTAPIPCKARAYTLMSTREVIRTSGIHSDPPDPSGVEVAKITSTIKRRCEETSEAPSSLINTALVTATTATLGRMNRPQSISRLINRHRNARSAAPSNPDSRGSIVIPEAYRIYEVFVVLAERAQCVVPVAYALLPDQSSRIVHSDAESLERGLAGPLSRQRGHGLRAAMMIAVRACFPPETRIQGCFFHLVKNIKLRVAQEGLWSRYTNDDDFALKARMIAALAFVPPSELDNAVAELSPVLPEELIPVLNYFEDIYIGRMNRIRADGTVDRRTPQFPVEMWSVYQRTLDGEARTNNYAEAAHRRLQVEFGIQHPTIWKFIDGLKKVQKGRDLQVESFVAGGAPPTKRTKYVRADERILGVVERAEHLQHVEYLRGIAHNFLMDA